MKVIWSVFSRELLDITRDRRRFIWMLVSSLIIFPLFFAGPYALLFMRAGQQTYDKLTIPVQGIKNAPALISFLADQKDIEALPADNVEELVLSKQYSIGLIIPDDYQQKIQSGQSAQLTMVVDERRSLDVTATRLSDAIKEYSDSLLSERLKNKGLSSDFTEPVTLDKQNAATTTETTGSLLGLVIPGFIISIGLTAGMPLAVAAVAGEKKKQTLEPVLFTPVSRVQLLFAKLMAILTGVIFNLLLNLISFGLAGVVILFAILRFAPGMISASTPQSSSTPLPISGGYSLQPLALILFLISPFLIILFGAALQLLISSWARNDEEAYTLLTPLSFLSGLVVLVALFLDSFTPQLWHYSLPIFGTIISMRDLLSNKVDPASLTVMFVSSALYALLMLTLAVWMFNREEVVFRT